jgi:hypothetical protein
MEDELCIECGCPTGRAGAADDSLFASDGRGPFCVAYWDIAGFCHEASDDDPIHCEHWWDGDTCCQCGATPMTVEEKLLHGME